MVTKAYYFKKKKNYMIQYMNGPLNIWALSGKCVSDLETCMVYFLLAGEEILKIKIFNSFQNSLSNQNWEDYYGLLGGW